MFSNNSFLKSFPLSVSGWGIREVVTVYLFSYFNLSNEIVLSISISLGVIILVSSFYGLIISILLNLKLKVSKKLILTFLSKAKFL